MTADCPSGKVRHPSEAVAKRKAITVATKTHDRQRAYQCPTCRDWHLTSAPKYPERLPKRLRRRGTPLPPPQPASPDEVAAWFARHQKP